MGGAPKHLQQIALHMGRKGHDVTVLCTKSEANPGSFYWHPHVEVRAVLPFKQPFPEPYAVAAYELGQIVDIVATYLKTADRFYMHDGEFLFPYVYRNIPTVVSLRDNLYPETILGGYLFAAHRLILISQYSRNYYLATVGSFFPEFSERARVIYNGLDWQRFTQTDTNEIRNFLGLTADERPIVLHPHRPERSKGLMQTIAVADLLVHQYGFSKLLVLAPKWHELQTSTDLLAIYEVVKNEVRDRDLEQNFLFHDWVPQDLMPQYYSLGNVTFSLGSFPESFGNAVYESLGCGTLAVVSRISTHRELVPDELLRKVDYGDIDGAARVAADIIQNNLSTPPELLDYLHSNYSLERQMSAYENLILNAEIAEPMTFVARDSQTDNRFKLAPWCYISDQSGVYHDFRAGYVRDDRFIQLVKSFPNGFTADEAQAYLSADFFTNMRNDGYLVTSD